MKRRSALLASLLFAPVLPALAQQPAAWPVRPVRILVGVPPAGLQDLLARHVADRLSKAWGQAVIVENKPGATGLIAANTVAKAEPDGYTILMSTANNMESAPLLQKNLPFDPVKDFVPVVGLSQVKAVVTVSNAIGVNNVQELARLAASKPGTLNYGSWGVGSVAHLDGQAFAKSIKGELTHVPYKGGNDVMLALASNQIQMAVTAVSTALPLVKDGRIKALAYTGDKRSPLMPDIPTVAELGYTYDRPGGVFSLYLPAAAPRALVERIAEDTTKALATPAFSEFLDANAMEAYPLRGAELAKQLDASRRNYLARMKDLNIHAD